MGRTNGYWPKHPKKDLQALLLRFHRLKWRVEFRSGGNYYKVKCGCPGRHYRNIHKSPSGANYALDVRKWLDRTERECLAARREEAAHEEQAQS